MNKYIVFLMIISSVNLWSQDEIELQLISNEFTEPVDIANAGDDRIFVVEQPGVIKIMDKEGNIEDVDFLDIRNRVRDGGERGLLGLVFHPNYTSNGYFFVNYTNNSGTSIIARYSVNPSNANIADADSEKILLEVPQPFGNHNAGDLAFGPDGYLYIALGDGGDGGDPGNRSQTRTQLLGKMLRIDVDNGDPYNIPADNPFVLEDFTLDEIWAIGLRNPWRFSFDRLTGDMWIADVGQGKFEEIHFQPADSRGGENYGWRCYEGNDDFILTDCPDANELTFPIIDYAHDVSNCGGSVTGGFVYRGNDFPGLQGKYFYADYCTGQIWALERMEEGSIINTEIFDGPSRSYTTFGEDNNGELYIARLNGEVSRVIQPNVTNIEDSLVDFKFNIVPNPSNGPFTITFENAPSEYFNVSLVDVKGRIFYQQEHLINNQLQLEINLPNLGSGIYFLELQHEKVKYARRVVKR